MFKMVYRTRTNYSAKQKAEIWDRWQHGESMISIGRVFDRESSSIFSQLALWVQLIDATSK